MKLLTQPCVQKHVFLFEGTNARESGKARRVVSSKWWNQARYGVFTKQLTAAGVATICAELEDTTFTLVASTRSQAGRERM